MPPLFKKRSIKPKVGSGKGLIAIHKLYHRLIKRKQAENATNIRNQKGNNTIDPAVSLYVHREQL